MNIIHGAGFTILHNHDFCGANSKRLGYKFHASVSEPGVNKKHKKFLFEYQVIFQKSYLNTGCFEKSIFAYLKFDICILNIRFLHTKFYYRENNIAVKVIISWFDWLKTNCLICMNLGRNRIHYGC